MRNIEIFSLDICIIFYLNNNFINDLILILNNVFFNFYMSLL